MKDLRYERIAQVIAVAAVGDTNRGISQYYIEPCELKVKFTEYVKSQVHLNIVHGLYGRTLREYVEALWFLNGRTSCQNSAMQVLRYFYSDVACFLIHNKYTIDFVLEVDTNLFKCQRVNLDVDVLAAELEKDLDAVLSGQLPIQQWKYASLLDVVDDVADLKEKTKNYALAFELQKYCEDRELILIESR